MEGIKLNSWLICYVDSAIVCGWRVPISASEPILVPSWPVVIVIFVSKQDVEEMTESSHPNSSG